MSDIEREPEDVSPELTFATNDELVDELLRRPNVRVMLVTEEADCVTYQTNAGPLWATGAAQYALAKFAASQPNDDEAHEPAD